MASAHGHLTTLVSMLTSTADLARSCKELPAQAAEHDATDQMAQILCNPAFHDLDPALQAQTKQLITPERLYASIGINTARRQCTFSDTLHQLVDPDTVHAHPEHFLVNLHVFGSTGKPESDEHYLIQQEYHNHIGFQASRVEETGRALASVALTEHHLAPSAALALTAITNPHAVRVARELMERPVDRDAPCLPVDFLTRTRVHTHAPAYFTPRAEHLERIIARDTDGDDTLKALLHASAANRGESQAYDMHGLVTAALAQTSAQKRPARVHCAFTHDPTLLHNPDFALRAQERVSTLFYRHVASDDTLPADICAITGMRAAEQTNTLAQAWAIFTGAPAQARIPQDVRLGTSSSVRHMYVRNPQPYVDHFGANAVVNALCDGQMQVQDRVDVITATAAAGITTARLRNTAIELASADDDFLSDDERDRLLLALLDMEAIEENT